MLQNGRRFPVEAFCLYAAIVLEDRIGIGFFPFGTALRVIVMDREPRCPRRKTGLGSRRPLHRRPGIVAAVGLDETQGLCRRKAFVQSQLILAVRRNVIVVFNVSESRIGHAQFLPFINEGRTAQSKQNRCHGLGRLLLIRPFREIAVDTTYLVVVLKEDGIPAVSGRRLLAVGQGLLELGQGPRFGPAPDFIIGKF